MYMGAGQLSFCPIRSISNSGGQIGTHAKNGILRAYLRYFKPVWGKSNALYQNMLSRQF